MRINLKNFLTTENTESRSYTEHFLSSLRLRLSRRINEKADALGGKTISLISYLKFNYGHSHDS